MNFYDILTCAVSMNQDKAEVGSALYGGAEPRFVYHTVQLQVIEEGCGLWLMISHTPVMLARGRYLFMTVWSVWLLHSADFGELEALIVK